jgi:DNA polymerase III subunit beta
MIKGSITVRPQAFAAAVKWAAKFIALKPAAPVQGGLLLEVDDSGLAVTAYSENITARAYVTCEGAGAGRVVVSGRLLADLAGTFPDKEVTITGDEGAEQVTITVGRWRGTLPSMDLDEWPTLPAEPGAIGTVGGDTFASMIADVNVATKKDGKGLIWMACMHLAVGDARITALATDSARAARSSVPFGPMDGEDDVTGLSALVLGATMAEVAGAFTGPDDITIGLDAGSISLTSQTRSVVLRQMAEKFDAVTVGSFFAQAAELPEHAQVKREELLQPMKRAAIIREKEGPIKVSFSADLITLAAAAEDVKRDSDEEVEAVYAGPDHTLAFNPKYFAEAIASAPGEVVDITMTTERVTGVLLRVADTAWEHVLMPLRGR